MAVDIAALAVRPEALADRLAHRSPDPGARAATTLRWSRFADVLHEEVAVRGLVELDADPAIERVAAAVECWIRDRVGPRRG